MNTFVSPLYRSWNTTINKFLVRGEWKDLFIKRNILVNNERIKLMISTKLFLYKAE